MHTNEALKMRLFPLNQIQGGHETNPDKGLYPVSFQDREHLIPPFFMVLYNRRAVVCAPSGH